MLSTSPDRLAVDLKGFTTTADPTSVRWPTSMAWRWIARAGRRLRTEQGSLDVLVEGSTWTAVWVPTAAEAVAAADAAW